MGRKGEKEKEEESDGSRWRRRLSIDGRLNNSKASCPAIFKRRAPTCACGRNPWSNSASPNKCILLMERRRGGGEGGGRRFYVSNPIYPELSPLSPRGIGNSSIVDIRRSSTDRKIEGKRSSSLRRKKKKRFSLPLFRAHTRARLLFSPRYSAVKSWPREKLCILETRFLSGTRFACMWWVELKIFPSSFEDWKIKRNRRVHIRFLRNFLLIYSCITNSVCREFVYRSTIGWQLFSYNTSSHKSCEEGYYNECKKERKYRSQMR